MKYTPIIVLAILATMGSGGLGLRCWECDSDDSDCDDVSNHRDQECDSDSVCNRLVLNGKVNLDCAPGEGVTLGCRRGSGEDNVQCYCDSDLCNKGTTSSLSILVLASLGLTWLVLN